MKHELCPTCQPLGECQFERYANSTAGNVPSLKKQAQIEKDPSKKAVFETLAHEASDAIAKFRIIARDEYLCKRVNEVLPNFTGIEKL